MTRWRMAWRQLLSLETGRSVYNMSLPGYGPGQSLLQLDEALSLSPSLVIVAPYLGNDFYDAYELALRHPDLAESLPAALREAAAARERLKPLEQEVFPLFELGQPPATPTPSVTRRLLSEHVKLYGLLRALRHRFITDRTPDPLLSRKFSTAARSLTPLQRQFASAFDAPGWRTILTAPYRGRVLDDRDPRIRLGFEIARRAVRTAWTFWSSFSRRRKASSGLRFPLRTFIRGSVSSSSTKSDCARSGSPTCAPAASHISTRRRRSGRRRTSRTMRTPTVTPMRPANVSSPPPWQRV